MRKRYKLLLIIVISFLLVIFIYYIYNKKKITYVALGDNLSYNKFSTYNYAEHLKYILREKDVIYYDFLDDKPTIDNILNSLNQNSKGINYVLKNADFVTLCIGDYELNNYKVLDDNIVRNYLLKVSNLLLLLQKLNPNIYLILLNNENYTNIQQKIENFSLDQGINNIYIKIVGTNNIFYSQDKTHLNWYGHKKLADIIVKEHFYGN